MEKNNNENEDHLKTIITCSVLTILYGLVAYLPEQLNLIDIITNDETPGLLYISIIFLMRFILSGIFWILIIPLIFYFINNQSLKNYLSNFRFGTKNQLLRNVSIGILASIAFFLVSSLIALLLGIFNFDFGIFRTPSWDSGLGWFIFILALIPGIWEELAFRGIILALLLDKFSKKKAFLIDGLLFGFFHIFNLILGRDLSSVLFELLYAIPVGIAFAYMAVKSNSIIPCIITHYFVDIILFTFNESFILTDELKAIIFVLLAIIIFLPIIIISLTRIMVESSRKKSEI